MQSNYKTMRYGSHGSISGSLLLAASLLVTPFTQAAESNPVADNAYYNDSLFTTTLEKPYSEIGDKNTILLDAEFGLINETFPRFQTSNDSGNTDLMLNALNVVPEPGTYAMIITVAIAGGTLMFRNRFRWA